MPSVEKKAIVVGAGIIGLTSALRLAEAGFAVKIIEREDEVCAGSSYANAGQLLYDRIGAMGSPGFLKSLPRGLFDPDQGISAMGLSSRQNWPWAMAFLRQCTTKRWQDNTRAMLKLAAQSRSAMQQVQAEYDLKFDWRKPGKLIVHASQGAVGAAALSAQFQAQFGGQHQVIGRAGCLAKEPALAATKREIAGGIYLPDAEVGDCQKFGQSLLRVLRAKFDVEIALGETVQSLELKDGQATELRTDKGAHQADVFVLATGKSVHELLPEASAISKPLVGVKGVSLTYPAGGNPPELSVTDAAGKFVVMRLGKQIRIAGYALFEDGDDIKPEYVEKLTQKARALMPQAARYEVSPKVWVGIRPQTPDDMPMIGPCGAENVFVNAGHGSLGWTFAMGSAERLLKQINATADA